MYAVIDVGSNTIRFSVYRLEHNNIEPFLQKKNTAGLANYVDERGNLSDKGISKAVSVLSKFKKILSDIEIDHIYAFATASLRNIGNTQEARTIIKEQTGLDLQVLSGEQEAVCGFIGATRRLPVTDGILADIGGGSTELVFYQDGRIQKALSMPVGSLNMYARHVKRLVPGKSELKAIAETVRTQLDQIDKPAGDFERLCGVGGTIRAACKLNNEIFGMPASNRTLDARHIDDIIKTVRGNNKESLGPILKVVPERIHTVIPGMTILQTIADYFHSKTIDVSKYGIREGYLLQVLTNEGIVHD